MSEVVRRAKELAYRAHAGQVDKAGRPYIEHVARVAERVREYCLVSSDPALAFHGDEAEAVAWLHDVIEDAPKYEAEMCLSVHGGIRSAVYSLTRRRGEPTGRYYAAVRANPIALRVKLADIADNADESRLALLDEKTAARLRRKYAKARKALTEPEGDGRG